MSIGRDGIFIGRVIKVHQHDNSLDIQLVYDNSRLTGVPLMAPQMTTSSGFVDMPHPEGNDWDKPGSKTRDCYVICAKVGSNVIAIGFIPDQVNQMMFDRKNFKVDRHASDVYTTIDEFGNSETRHPSGTYVRVAEDPNHEDLFEKDFDKLWDIARNKDKAPYIHVDLRVANVHKCSILMTPTGDIEVHAVGHIAIRSDKDTYIHADGDLQISANGDVGVRAGKDAYVHSDGDMQASAGGDAAIRAEGDVFVHANGDLQASAGGDVGVRADGDAFVHSIGDMQLSAGGDVGVRADGDAFVHSIGDMQVSAGGDVGIRADGDAFIHANGDLQASAGGDIGIRADGETFIHAIGDLQITTDGDAAVRSKGDAYVHSDGDTQVSAVGDVGVVAGGNAFVTSDQDVEVSGVNVKVTASAKIKLKATGDVDLNADGVFNIVTSLGTHTF